MNPNTTYTRNKIVALLLFTVITLKAQLPGLTITGIPENTTNGATWTYQGTDNGVFYSLQGILMKPQGNGPFPAVIINHGTGGNFNGYSKKIAQEMVQWGYVCIATNYTHAGNSTSCGHPGQCVEAEFGGSPNNILRAMKCWDILASFDYVGENCIHAFGHSRGAYLTTAMVAAHPGKFRAAGHTAGGIVRTSINDVVPDANDAMNISCAYIMHHGDDDNTVPLSFDERLDSVFNVTDINHALHIYPDFNHSDISFDPIMFSRTKEFFDTHGCRLTTPIVHKEFKQLTFSLHPNPATSVLNIRCPEKARLSIINSLGKEIMIANIDRDEQTIDLNNFPEGMYWCVLRSENAESSQKLVIRR